MGFKVWLLFFFLQYNNQNVEHLCYSILVKSPWGWIVPHAKKKGDSQCWDQNL